MDAVRHFTWGNVAFLETESTLSMTFVFSVCANAIFIIHINNCRICTFTVGVYCGDYHLQTQNGKIRSCQHEFTSINTFLELDNEEYSLHML